MARTHRVVLLGPPGSGKGTQGEVLSKRLSIPAISTGEMLRSAVAQGSELGRRVEGIMQSGSLVDDGTMLEVVRERLAQADAQRGFLLDGFPRTLAQAEALGLLLGEAPISTVLSVEVPEEELVRRMVGRGRNDDTPEVVRERQRIYREQTEPLIGYYRARGSLRTIDGFRPIGEVTAQMLAALGEQG